MGGLLSREDWLASAARARLFVNASRVEDYGISQLEALSAGAALVTVPSAGPYEALPIARRLAAGLVDEDLAAALAAGLALDDAELRDYRERPRGARAIPSGGGPADGRGARHPRAGARLTGSLGPTATSACRIPATHASGVYALASARAASPSAARSSSFCTTVLSRVASASARAAGFFHGGFLIGGMAGPAVGGLLSAISLTAPFFFYAGTLAVAGTVGLVLLHSRRSPAGAARG